MAEGLQTAEGTPVDVPAAGASDDDLNRQFQQAMNAPEPTGPTVPAPPKRDPEAPYGRKADGSPKKGPGGRPPKAVKDADKPRVQSAAAAASAEPKDYRQGLAELADSAWAALVVFDTPTTKAQAAILQASIPGLVNGFNLAAQNNGMIRGGVEFLTRSTWVTVVAMAVLPFAQASLALWTGRFDEGAVVQLAAATDQLKARREHEAAEAMLAAAAGMATAA